VTASRGGLLLALLALVASGPATTVPADAERDRAAERERMVSAQLEARGVENPRVLDAMRRVPRHRFVPAAHRDAAYEDRPLPVGRGQTISQPYMVAVMTELLEPERGDRVLEIGTGSGYQAAILSELVAQVYSIEIIPELAERARRLLAAGGWHNVVVVTGDGYRGLAERAPFDGILVTAAPERVPEPLLEQLAVGGCLVIPVGRQSQWLQVLERTESGIETKTLFEVRFVPMTGEAERRR
jgi:protein-L-isoaspartate(D-aspartate) O-methyltransferase